MNDTWHCGQGVAVYDVPPWHRRGLWLVLAALAVLMTVLVVTGKLTTVLSVLVLVLMLGFMAAAAGVVEMVRWFG